MLSDRTISNLKKNITSNSKFNIKAGLIKCMGDPTCLKILYIISREKEVCPSDLVSILGISMPAISHQLARLKQMGVVKTKRMGQIICYSFSDTKEAKSIKNIIKTIAL
ncbi:MAG: winged helix-turn-helix transcriptional regulator [Candidatus Levybacteria bacterium]|nr:winged helix-turn-helix transcriptional regulator [Candidatus Levybacteria bacterium]